MFLFLTGVERLVSGLDIRYFCILAHMRSPRYGYTVYPVHLGGPGLKDDGMDCPVAGSLGRTVSRLRQRDDRPAGEPRGGGY
jgi:hypothetical protein